MLFYPGLYVKQCKIATVYITTIEILRIRRENTAWMKFMAMK